LFVSIVALKDAYKMSLQNEFATKQPHIKIEYIDNNILLSQSQIKTTMRQIKDISNSIDTISPYTDGNRFFVSVGYKGSSGNAQYSGSIKVIGLGVDNFVYDFFDSSFVEKKPFEVLYTPLEFVYALRTMKNIMVFNHTLFNSYFPVIQSVDKFNFTSGNQEYEGKLASIFNDYDKYPIIYTTIPFANKLLNQNPDKIVGFFVNSKNLNDINKLTILLRNKLPKDKFIVSSWLELRQKQFMMFFLFESLSILIVAIILVLSILFVLLLLYNAIVKKSYQLSVLYTIGFLLKNEIFISIAMIIFVVSVVAILLLYYLIPILTTLINLPYDMLIMYNYVFYIGGIDVLFMFVSYILIGNSYKIKSKSIF
jgi:ABC-type lipoprotein release transport system permease subunit